MAPPIEIRQNSSNPSSPVLPSRNPSNAGKSESAPPPPPPSQPSAPGPTGTRKFCNVALHSLIEIVDMVIRNKQLDVLKEFIDERLLMDIPNMHESFLDVIVTLLTNEHERTVPLKQIQDKLILNIGLFFKMLVKFMYQHIQQTRMVKRSRRFSTAFTQNLTRLTELLCLRMARVNYERPVDMMTDINDPVRVASRALVNFFRDLYWLCEVGFVTQLVSIMLQHDTFAIRPEAPTQQARLRMEVIKLLSEHEAWVQLNFPNFADTNLRQLKLTKQFSERHYLVAELLRMVQFSITPLAKKSSKPSSILHGNVVPEQSESDDAEMIKLRNKTLEDFHSILLKMSLDNRFKSDQDQSRIVLLFSPFVGYATRNLRELNFEAIAGQNQFFVFSYF